MFGINHKETSIDLLSYLRKEWQKFKSDFADPPTYEVKPEVDEFVNWAQDFLKKNPPVNQAYLSEGFGLMLQNGELVTFTKDAQPIANTMRDEAIHITSPLRYPGQSDMAPSITVAITK